MHKYQLMAIGETLPWIVKPGMTAQELMKAARKAFPQASKKQIVRAALYSVILYAGTNPSRARQLPDVGIKSKSPSQLSTMRAEACRGK
jgi:hypothetical protein